MVVRGFESQFYFNSQLELLVSFSYPQSKLVGLVANQLVEKEKLPVGPMPDVLRDYPKLELWLRIVGIPELAIKVGIFFYFTVNVRLFLLFKKKIVYDNKFMFYFHFSFSFVFLTVWTIIS